MLKIRDELLHGEIFTHSKRHACWPNAGASITTPNGRICRWAINHQHQRHSRPKVRGGMEKWKAKNASHFSTPTTTTPAGRYLTLPLRNTNTLAGTKCRAGQGGPPNPRGARRPSSTWAVGRIFDRVRLNSYTSRQVTRRDEIRGLLP
jgi:hypothetical protein